MSRILVCYGSSEGHTAAIADRMGDVLADEGHDPLVISTKHPPPTIDLERYAGIVVAASVHRGRHQRHATAFVKRHVDRLNRVPSAFVSVSLTAATTGRDAEETTSDYVDAFLEGTGWEPTRTHVVGGALKYRQYGLLTGYLMRRIAGRSGLGTGSGRDYDYTDWVDVEDFTREFARLVENEPEPTSSH